MCLRKTDVQISETSALFRHCLIMVKIKHKKQEVAHCLLTVNYRYSVYFCDST